jgi:molybdopterin-guanine dinucleotide biosynthesis protein A
VRFIDVAVVVLAGGEGSRIGGRKPLRRLGGERLIDRAVRLARRWSDCVAVAVRDPAQLPDLDARLMQDNPVEGPLGGLIAALGLARAAGKPLLLVIPADTPFLPDNLLARLREGLGRDGCVLASSGGRVHPVCSLWRAEVVPRASGYIETGRRSLRGYAEFVGMGTIEWPAEPRDPFFNINSAEDLEVAEKRLADESSRPPPPAK